MYICAYVYNIIYSTYVAFIFQVVLDGRLEYTAAPPEHAVVAGCRNNDLLGCDLQVEVQMVQEAQEEPVLLR